MDMEEENIEVGDSRVRVFVGGLGEGVTSDDIRRMFGSLGTVDGVDIIRTKGRSFAYVDFIPSPTDQNSLSKLFSRYNGCLWKGGKLKLEKAKEHYFVRLKREWEENAKLASSDEPGTSPDPDESIPSTEMPSKESLKTKKLRIFFPKLRKESELNKAKVLKDEPNKNKLEVQKCNDIAPDKKRKPSNNFEGKRNDSTYATSDGKRRMHKQPDEMSSQVHSTELGSGFSEPTKVSWSQKSSWRELPGDGGRSSYNASHMLLDSNSSEKQGSDGFCEPESAKNKTEHIEMEGGEEIEPAKAEVMEELAEARPTIQNATSKESGRGVAWKQKQSWTQLIGPNNNAFSISQIFPEISSQKPVAKEPAENLAGSGDAEYIDLAKESNNESVGDGFNLVKSGPEKKHSVLAKHASIESIGDGLNMTRSTPEKSQHVAGNDIASASINEEKCDTLTSETSTTEIKIGETCSFMKNAASLKEWAKTKAALSGSLKRKRGEKK